MSSDPRATQGSRTQQNMQGTQHARFHGKAAERWRTRIREAEHPPSERLDKGHKRHEVANPLSNTPSHFLQRTT
jgi:hypothetical protein